MKLKTKLLASAMACFTAGAAVAGTTGMHANLQTHSNKDSRYTLEFNHTFDTNTVIYLEITGKFRDGQMNSDDSTQGIEQRLFTSADNKFWLQAGFNHVTVNGQHIETQQSTTSDKVFYGNSQYRPLLKAGYNFDNGAYLSGRYRYHYDAEEGHIEDRYDLMAGWNFESFSLRYNSVIHDRNTDVDSTVDHEFRVYKNFANWSGRPYVDYRNQALLVGGKEDKRNHALVVGLLYTF